MSNEMYSDLDSYCSKINNGSNYYGLHKPILFLKKNLIFTIGPNWKIFSCAFSCLMILSVLINYLTFHRCSSKIEGDKINIFSHKEFLRFWITASIAILQHSIYLWTSLKNPGIIYSPESKACESKFNSTKAIFIELKGKNKTISKGGSWLCQVCNIYKQGSSTHCSYCKICIEDYSHHCPWIGKCIGKGNRTSFKLLKIITALYFLINLFAVFPF